MPFNVYDASGQLILQNQPSTFTIGNLAPNTTYANYKVEDVDSGKTIALKPLHTSVKPATSVSATPDTLNLSLSSNKTGTIQPSFAPEDTTDVITYSSSNPSIATVQDGTVTAVGVGNAYISVLLGSQSASVKVNVAN